MDDGIRRGPGGVAIATGGLTGAGPARPGEPMLRWSSRTRSIAGVQAELERIWSSISLTTPGEAGDERRVAARSSVMNLVVIAGRGETGERAAAVVHGLTGRHPSRTLIVTPADPDGPSWVDAQVQAYCVLPSHDSPETCAELVYLTVGGESGQHLAGIVAPLLVHDLPVTVWWPGEPRFESPTSRDLLAMADRVMVDGSGWAGDGIDCLVELAHLPAAYHVDVADFGLLRQSRWREAIASTFDLPRLRPFLGMIRRLSVTYAAHDGTPGSTNVVKPLYHLAWLASRLGMAVVEPLTAGSDDWSGYAGLLRAGRRRVEIELRPVESTERGGTTLGVRIVAARRKEELETSVSAEASGVMVKTTVDGVAMPDRQYFAPRRREADLLAETIEDAGANPLVAEALAMAATIVGRQAPARHRRGPSAARPAA
jgi:glucose-6-phosphate dehydrogenase assembly protein OpcA